MSPCVIGSSFPSHFICLFLEVWLGEYKGQKVAIKMLKEIKSVQATQQFLAEASVMTYVSLHLHCQASVMSVLFPPPYLSITFIFQDTKTSESGQFDRCVIGQPAHVSGD